MLRATAKQQLTDDVNKVRFNNKIAIFGDSITAQNDDYSAGSSFNTEGRGYLTWFQYLSGGAFDYSFEEDGTGGNFGVGGDKTSDALNRISAVVAYKPDYCIVLIGTNDCNNASITYSTTQTNLDTIYQTLLSAGIQVIAIPILPRADSSWGASDRRDKSLKVNNWIRNYNRDVVTTSSNKLPIIVSDPTNYLIDSTSATGDPLTGYTNDGLHPTEKGAYWIGYKLWEDLSHLIPRTRQSTHINQADAYNATYNPTGNLLTNGMMLGTAGTLSIGTGSLASNFTLENGSGSGITVIASKGTTALDGSAGTHQILYCSTAGTGATGNSVYFREDLSTNFAAGDRIFATAQIRIRDIVGAGVVGVRLHIRQEGSTTFAAKALDPYDYTRPATTEDRSGIITIGAPMTLLTGVTNLRCRVEILIDGTTTTSVYVDIGNFAVRKVV